MSIALRWNDSTIFSKIFRLFPTAPYSSRKRFTVIKLLLAALVLFCFSACKIGINGTDDTDEKHGEFPWPASPPVRVCGNAELLSGPQTPPEGAIRVPAGDNSDVNWHQPGTTFWFAPGVHTLGDGLYSQIIPADNTTFIGAPGAIIDGQNQNYFAFTQHATNVTIRYLEIRNFGTGASNNDQDVVNHDAGENWTIEYNYVHNNDGAGVFIGSGSVIRYNCLKDNGQYGFSSYDPDGVYNVVFDHNEVVGNNQDDWESRREGCGCTGGGKFWDTHGAVVTNNWVHDNFGTGLWADHNNSNFLFENNYIADNDGIGLFYEVSYNFIIRGNTFKRNAIVAANGGRSFPDGAIYISESGGDTRAGDQYAKSEIAYNYFENNWDGIVLWENANRFCRPDEPFDTTNGCPFFKNTWGTRYKTQNITVHHNEFHFDKEAVGCTSGLCGRNAIFSNYGTSPANSPYLGYIIPWSITFQQNNVFHHNQYFGDWHFVAFEATQPDGTVITWEEWTAPAPPVPDTFTHGNRPGTFGQDAGSTYNGKENQ